jgi:RNA polymerase sigma-70 factor (ECF subfamily)
LEQPAVAGVGRNGKDEKGAVRATAEIFSQHGGFIHAVLRFQAGTRFDSEDLFQEFFLVLIHKPVPPDVRVIRSYLYRAIVNYVIDLVQKQVSCERHLKKYVAQTRIFINNRPSKNAFVEEEERNARVAYLVRHLQKREAQAFALRYRDHRSIGEIAERMGVDKRTVSRYLCQGVKKLRGILAVE